MRKMSKLNECLKVALLCHVFSICLLTVCGADKNEEDNDGMGHTFTISGHLEIPDVSEKFPSIMISLNQREYTTFVKQDGSFDFDDVKEGRYTMEVLSETYMFSQFKVDVSSNGRVRVLEYKYPGASKEAVGHPIVVEAHTKFKYFIDREKFSLKTILANPTFLMMGVTLLLAFVMPKMMKNMDPEEMKEMQAQMQDNDPQKMLSNMFGGGKKDEDDD